jgi:Zn-dependent membrane protease YugP
MYYGLESGLTMILFFAALIITIYAQCKINSSYSKYKKKKASKNVTGLDVARQILDKNGLSNVYVVATNGELTDHYDPTRKVVKLSNDIYNGNTIAAISVAAHECGHAIQDKENYKFMRIRAALVPFVNLVSYLGYFGLIVSLFAGITGYLKLSLLTLVATCVFQLVTLPVEFDASKRAMKELEKLGLASPEDKKGVKSMLSAAAFTYVASLLSTLLNIMRIVIMLNDRDNR